MSEEVGGGGTAGAAGAALGSALKQGPEATKIVGAPSGTGAASGDGAKGTEGAAASTPMTAEAVEKLIADSVEAGVAAALAKQVDEAKKAAEGEAAKKKAEAEVEAKKKADPGAARVDEVARRLEATEASLTKHLEQLQAKGRLDYLRERGVRAVLSDAELLALAPRVDVQDRSGAEELERWVETHPALFEARKDFVVPTPAKVVESLPKDLRGWLPREHIAEQVRAQMERDAKRAAAR